MKKAKIDSSLENVLNDFLIKKSHNKKEVTQLLRLKKLSQKKDLNK